MSTFDTGLNHTDAPIWPTAIKWGVISGGIGIVLTMLFYNMGMMEPENTSGFWISTLISTALGFAFVYLGLKNFRDSSNRGHLTLGKGVVWSLGFGLIAGVIGAIFFFIFCTYLAPEYIGNIMDLQMAEMEEQGMSDDQLEATAKGMGFMMNAPVFAITGLIFQLTLSIIEGLIASFILKTR